MMHILWPWAIYIEVFCDLYELFPGLRTSKSQPLKMEAAVLGRGWVLFTPGEGRVSGVWDVETCYENRGAPIPSGSQRNSL